MTLRSFWAGQAYKAGITHDKRIMSQTEISIFVDLIWRQNVGINLMWKSCISLSQRRCFSHSPIVFPPICIFIIYRLKQLPTIWNCRRRFHCKQTILYMILFRWFFKFRCGFATGSCHPCAKEEVRHPTPTDPELFVNIFKWTQSSKCLNLSLLQERHELGSSMHLK